MTQAASILDKQKAILAGKITVGVNKVSTPFTFSTLFILFTPRLFSTDARPLPASPRGERLGPEAGCSSGGECSIARRVWVGVVAAGTRKGGRVEGRGGGALVMVG